jgi:hypothetical protein
MFSKCKFPLKKALLRYSEEGTSSLCARVRAAIQKAKLPFCQRLVVKVGGMNVVHEMVVIRAKYAGCVHHVYYGKNICCFALLVDTL